MYVSSQMQRPKIYLHWTATGYQWKQPNHYHTIVTGDGVIHRMHDYNLDLKSHTYKRNTNSIGLACSCMGGADPWSLPPTAKQLKAMCDEVARLIKIWGWNESEICIRNIMTHAEAASNKDGCVMHENYGPVIWGGNGTRWDLMCLAKGGANDGGEILRGMIKESFQIRNSQCDPARSTSSHPLQGSRPSEMSVNELMVNVLLDKAGSSWAKVSDLLNAYGIPYIWDADKRRILLGLTDLSPRYVNDQVSIVDAFPTFELSLQGSCSQVILVGVIYEDNAYCKVLEFADELGISATFNPFKLLSMQGG